MRTYNFGRFSEYIAAGFLLLKGYSIVKMRYKHYTGEIDIIARKKQILVFVEVKSRKKLNNQYDVVQKRQLLRIKNAALFYLQRNRCYNKFDIRFDLIIISDFWNLKHIKNAW